KKCPHVQTPGIRLERLGSFGTIESLNLYSMAGMATSLKQATSPRKNAWHVRQSQGSQNEAGVFREAGACPKDVVNFTSLAAINLRTPQGKVNHSVEYSRVILYMSS
ncbi:MAG: hypothetical protein WBF93_04235, partial [Pirellulales bacterium]